MNYYVFYCPNESSYRYLGGTHYVGVWADDLDKATRKCTSYVGNTIYIENPPKGETIGYLY